MSHQSHSTDANADFGTIVYEDGTDDPDDPDDADDAEAEAEDAPPTDYVPLPAGFSRPKPWTKVTKEPSGEVGDKCPCGHQHNTMLKHHLEEDHLPEDFGLSPKRGWKNDPTTDDDAA